MRLQHITLAGKRLGQDLVEQVQVAQQIHWKPPGATRRSGYRFHQDLRFRDRPEAYTDLMTSYINTGLAIVNGCQEPLFPGFERAVLIPGCSGLR